MSTLHERQISQSDAARLAAVIDARAHTHPFERDDLEELADTLAAARVLPVHEVAGDSASLGARVGIRMRHEGVPPSRTSLHLVEPGDAEPAQGRISVVSPLGRTLIGLRPGMRALVALPGGREAEVEVLSVEPQDAHRLRADAVHQ